MILLRLWKNEGLRYEGIPCSWMEIAEPDLKHSRTDVDFGKGFYTTPLREQAVKWCGKFKRRGKQESLQHMNLMKARAVA